MLGYLDTNTFVSYTHTLYPNDPRYTRCCALLAALADGCGMVGDG